ncbi:hypothetical protein BDL97_11G039500 [Sphagnum fallax]|nr:hypothetical protein BDL97_11G039500 [Sphagnum fallax]
MYAGRGRDSIPGRLLPQMRRMDRHRPGCFLLLLLLRHHCAPPAAAAAAFRRSHLRSDALCALQIQNPSPHNAIHRFRHDRHQEQDQEDNKNKVVNFTFFSSFFFFAVLLARRQSSGEEEARVSGLFPWLGFSPSRRRSGRLLCT